MSIQEGVQARMADLYTTLFQLEEDSRRLDELSRGVHTLATTAEIQLRQLRLELERAAGEEPATPFLPECW